MPFHLHFDESDLLRCRFALSPLWETQQAVRTLLRPGRHGYHEPWLRRIRSAAAGLDLGPLWSLMPESGHNPDFLSLPPLGPYASFEEEIAGVRAIGPELVREDLALTLACVPGALDSPPDGRYSTTPPAHSGSCPRFWNRRGGSWSSRTGRGCARCWRRTSRTTRVGSPRSASRGCSVS